MALRDDRQRLSAALLVAVLVLLVYLVYRIFEPFLVPLAWAGVLVVVFYPWHTRFEKRWGPNRAAALSTLAVTLILILPVAFLAAKFVREGIDAARRIQAAFSEGQIPWVQQGWDWVIRQIPGEHQADVATLAREGAERVATFLASRVGAVVRNVVGFVFDLFVMLFAMFYLFRDAGGFVRDLRRLLPFEERHREPIIRQARDLINASVTSSLIVAAVQGLLGGILFAALGLAAPVFWGVVMAFFSLLPLVGAWIVWVPAAGWLLVQGETVRAIILVAVGAGVVGTVDNFLRPMLIGNRTQLSGLVIFISVLGGIGFFGMLGVVLGPIVVATVASLIDVYTHPPDEAKAPPGEEPETIRRTANAVLE